MNKQNLLNFLEQTSLNSINNKVTFDTDDSQITTVKCLSEDKQLISKIVIKDLFTYKNKFSIYDLDQFIKYMSLLKTDVIDYEFIDSGNGNLSMIKIKDKLAKIEYYLTDHSLIPQAPEFKKDPIYNYEINIDNETSSYIINSLEVTKSALIKFTIDNGEISCYIGNLNKESNIKVTLSNTVKLNDLSDSNKAKTQIYFNSQYLKNILMLNKVGLLKLSFDGIFCFENTIDKINVLFWNKETILNV